MSASVRDLFASDAGLEVVCDLPESHGYRRWFVVGRVPQNARHLPTHACERLGHSFQGEPDSKVAGVGHGA